MLDTAKSDDQGKAHRTSGVRALAGDVEGFGALSELALDVQWSWNHATDDIWRQLDPVLWEHTHNPRAILHIVSRQPHPTTRPLSKSG